MLSKQQFFPPSTFSGQAAGWRWMFVYILLLYLFQISDSLQQLCFSLYHSDTLKSIQYNFHFPYLHDPAAKGILLLSVVSLTSFHSTLFFTAVKSKTSPCRHSRDGAAFIFALPFQIQRLACVFHHNQNGYFSFQYSPFTICVIPPHPV